MTIVVKSQERYKIVISERGPRGPAGKQFLMPSDGYADETEVSDPAEGDKFMRDNGLLYRYNGSDWVFLGSFNYTAD